MNTGRTCPECGAPLPGDAPKGFCPKCLVNLGADFALAADTHAQPGWASASSQQTVVTPPADAGVEQPGMTIGRYKLLQPIGEGGFGVVFMAQQSEPVQRKVALKVIKAGMDTREVIARFEAERQALALMDHPNIAQVLDGGATASGRPYFVMELVRGLPITEYCDQCHLSTRERLELFIKVCRAVQHAHQKGVIHRDLKPSNVLVTLHDGEPVPKVIDFGVAKALGQKLTNKTLFTRFEQMIGTPAYMSPEQAALSGLDIDTRSDIYSLGVLLYELLTGVTPFDSETFRQAALDEIRRMIRETEPPKPSTRLTELVAADVRRLTTSATEKDRASLRQLLQQKKDLISAIRGDLDWITMKAMEKDRHRRYDTAKGLAADLERHLNHEPVLARPPSALYRFERAARRHRIAFASGGAVAIAVVLGMAISPWQSKLTNKVPPPSGRPNSELSIHVVSADGKPVPSARCTLVVGGYPSDDRGFPKPPKPENRLVKNTSADGNVLFRHEGLSNDKRHIVYLEASGFSGATRFLAPAEPRKGPLTIVLFKKLRVRLRYAFRPDGGLALVGDGVVSGTVTLYPMDDGSYRPPARAFFSFKQNKPVGSSGVLDLGISIDQRNGVLSFGGSNGRFDHCTDLGLVPFESLSSVEPLRLVREREDTPIKQNHTYIYESNIYPPETRTAVTGFDLCYAKIFVESIEQVPADESK